MKTVDVTGVIIKVCDVSSFKPKNGNPSKDKRTITLADESGLIINLTLWGKNANNENF